MVRRIVSTVLALSSIVPFSFLAWSSPPVYAAATSGSSALAAIEEFVSAPSSPGLTVIKGGAGSGLASTSELAGSSLSVSNEIAGVAADGAISLTPVGWAIAGGLATAAGGYYAYTHRRSLIQAVNNVWNGLSSSRQSTLEGQNSPGSSVSLGSGSVVSAVNSTLSSLSLSLSATASSLQNYQKIVVPQSWPSGAKLTLDFSPTNGWSKQYFGTFVSVPSLNVSANESINTGSGSSFDVESSEGNADGTGATTSFAQGKTYSTAMIGQGATYGGEPMNWGSGRISFSGLQAGQSLYVVSYGYAGNNNWNNTYPANQWMLSSGLVSSSYNSPSLVNGAVNVSMAAVPSPASFPSTVSVPSPTSSQPTFFPGSSANSQLQPIGQPAANPLVQSNPVQLPSGSPSPGFLGWLESLIVPSVTALENAILPLESSFDSRIPFSYVTALLKVLPNWADGGDAAGCAAFPVPQFGFGSDTSGTYHVQVCSSSFMGGAFNTLKTVFSVLIWAFMLGWGVMMFRRLIR